MTFWPESPCVPLRPLKHTCSLNPDILPEYTDPDLEFYYVDIGNVALETGIIDCVHMTFANAPSRARKLVKPGDIIVSTVRTYLKAVACIPEDTERLVVSTGFAVLRVKTEADPRFLYRLVQSNPFVEAIVAASTGVSYPAINPSTLGDISVPLPDLPTQKAIADFLDRETARIDQLIEKKQRMVEVLGEKRQAVISHAVTKGLDPDVPMKDSGVEWLEEIPQHWETIPLKWRATCSSGNRIATDEVLPVPIPEQPTTVPVIGGNGRMGHSIESNIQVTVLAIGRVGAHCGNIHIVSPPAWITDNALVLRVDRTTFELRYLADVLRFRNLNALAERSAQPLITGTQVRDQRLPCPPLPEQSAIAAFLDREIAKINGLNTSIRKTIDRLREFRSALITAAVTGQINVSTWGKQGTTERRLDQIEEAAST